jgi:hypothetical protein
VHIMRDYGVTYKSVPLMCDNSSAIWLAQNPVFHGRAKHIKVRHHFLRDHVEKGDIVTKHIDTERQLAVIFTKPRDTSRFAALQGELGLRGACALSRIYSILFSSHHISSYLPMLFLLHLVTSRCQIQCNHVLIRL